MANEGRRLVQLGYLPKELPCEFTSTSLASKYKAISTAINDASDKRKLKSADAEVFSLARGGHARRALRIPNPLHYVHQALIIGENWKSIEAITESSAISLSKPSFESSKIRATNLSPSSDLAESRLVALADKKYVLQTDFARFFSSIYTHSIPWALHGKAESKKNRETGGALFGNDIDKAVRDGQDGQTVGIPVSPDSSHILSELIAAKIDEMAFPNQVHGYRYVDDYFLCFATESDALAALDRLALAARYFELDLNYAKTSISRIQDNTDEVGLDELRDYKFSDLTKVSRQELHSFFALATKLNASQENALKYAVRILGQRTVSAADWEIFESYLLRSATISSNAMDVVVFSLYRHSLIGAPLNRERIIGYFAEIVVTGATYNFHSDVAWALWAFKSLSYSLPDRATEALSKTDNSVVAILALDLREKGLLDGTLSTTNWETYLNSKELYGEHWLLVYESIRSGWLKAKPSVIGNDPLFSLLANKNVKFYDENRTAKLTRELRAKPATDLDKFNYGPVQWFLLEIDKQPNTKTAGSRSGKRSHGWDAVGDDDEAESESDATVDVAALSPLRSALGRHWYY